jgi:hypothetical protein
VSERHFILPFADSRVAVSEKTLLLKETIHRAFAVAEVVNRKPFIAICDEAACRARRLSI